MPELPEVETYIRDLEPELDGRRIISARILWERTIAAPSAAEFAQAIVGQRFTKFGRRGKYMLLGLASGDTLIVHLRMTGKLQLEPVNVEPKKHTRVVLQLDDERSLHYNDPRKFGRMWLAPDPVAVVGQLGPEPLSLEFTPLGLAQKLAGRKASIKALLLDQRIVAGIGNIYADECLFRAGIHPARNGGSLTSMEIAALHEAIRAVLTRSIQQRGSSLGSSSLQNYLRLNGAKGEFQEEHQVFQRTGQPCYRCGRPIERIVLAQRSTHFCPRCQPAKPN